MTCFLYRHFNTDGTLLYVGITNHIETRTKQHKRSSSWFSEVASTTVEDLPSRDHALALERVAIEHESPLHNGKPARAKPKVAAPEISPVVELQGPLPEFDGILRSLSERQKEGLLLMGQVLSLMPDGEGVDFIERVGPARFIEVANMAKDQRRNSPPPVQTPLRLGAAQ